MAEMILWADYLELSESVSGVKSDNQAASNAGKMEFGENSEDVNYSNIESWHTGSKYILGVEIRDIYIPRDKARKYDILNTMGNFLYELDIDYIDEDFEFSDGRHINAYKNFETWWEEYWNGPHSYYWCYDQKLTIKSMKWVVDDKTFWSWYR